MIDRLPSPLDRSSYVWSGQTLSRRIAKGDDLAFTEMYRRFHQPVFRYCRSILGNEDDAKDALQNTMAKAMKVLPGEKRSLNLKAWLFRVARNECLDTLRLRRPIVDVTEYEPASDVDVALTASTRERLRQTLTDINQLPERQRSALVMRELNDLGFGDIAGALGTSTAVARQTVYEARLALQDLEQGRLAPCHDVRTAVSAGDRRVLRGRGLRAHLRACKECQAFSSNIDQRSRTLRSLVPSLSPVAAASVLGSITGAGGTGGAGALTGLVSATSVIGSGTKAVAVIVAVASVGAGATGVAHEIGSRSPPNPPGKGALVERSSSPLQMGPESKDRLPGRNVTSGMGTTLPVGSKTRENAPPASRRPGDEPHVPELDDPQPTVPGQPPPAEGTPPAGTESGGPPDSGPAKLPNLPGNLPKLPNLPGNLPANLPNLPANLPKLPNLPANLPNLPANLPQVDRPPIQPAVEANLDKVLKRVGGSIQK